MIKRLTTIQIVSQIKAELEQILEDESSLSALSEPSEAAIQLDVLQTRSHVCILVEVPGVEARDLEITVAGNALTVAGTRRAVSASAPGSRFLCVERQWGRFERQIELPAAVDPSKGHASLGNGLLKVDLPLLEDQRNKSYRLEIQDAGKGDT